MSISIHSTDIAELKQDIIIYPISIAQKADSSLPPIGLLNNGLPIEALNLYKDDYYDEKTPDGKNIRWTLPHSKKFPTFIQRHFTGARYYSKKDDFIKKIAESKPGKYSEPFPYQNFVYEYLRYGTPNRSLLLEHGLGSGKSRSMILVGESFRKQGLKILIFTPAFLKLNMLDEIERWGADDIRITKSTSAVDVERRRAIIKESYLFVNYNATGTGPHKPEGGKGGVFHALAKLGIGFPDGSEQSSAFPFIHKEYSGLQPPQKMLIVLEEAQGLNRSFISNADNAEKGTSDNIKAYLYPLLMQVIDCKFIALTATPMISNPFEMAPLYNILRGLIHGTGTAFPMIEQKFNELFVDYESNKIMNEDKFMSRIMGLGSYFKGITDDTEGLIYPTRKDYPDSELVMSAYQTYQHDIALNLELQKPIRKKKGCTLTAAQLELQPTSSYRSRSRQACNYVWPEEIPRPRSGDIPPTWETLGMSKWSFMEKHSFEFQIKVKGGFRPPKTVDEMGEIKDFINTKLQAEDFEQIRDNSVTEYKKFLTEIIATNNILQLPIKPPRSPKPDSIYYWLSSNDIRTLKMYMGDLNDRFIGAMTELVENGEKYLSLDNIKNKYSVKMATIYERITGDIENGACHVVFDGKKDDTKGINKSSDVDFVDGSLDGVQGDTEVDDSEIQAIADIKPKVSKAGWDPNDPLTKYMDVFKTDDELAKIGGRVVGGPSLVYSYFNAVEGAGIFSKILDQHGFTEFNDKTVELKPQDVERKPRYAFIRGGMILSLKINIMRIFNSKENVHGQLIRVVFITQAAAEGISLYNLRQIHIMEPFWDNVMIEQVEGRGFRIKAHQYIQNREDRYITVYKYVCVRPTKNILDEWMKRNSKGSDYYKQFKKIKDQDMTTDQYILNLANKKDVFREQVKLLRARAAVDCVNNGSYNEIKEDCFTFQDENGPSYTLNIDKDTETKTKIVGSKKHCVRKLSLANKSGVYLTFDEEDDVQILYTSKGVSIPMTAKLVYTAHKDWKETDNTDKSTMRMVGYNVTFDTTDGKKSKYLASCPEITLI